MKKHDNRNKCHRRRPCHTHKPHIKWSALSSKPHPLEDATVGQGAGQVEQTVQSSTETIVIKDSAEVTINTTETKAAIALQGALQVAIALVLSISIADSQKAEKITQELMQKSQIKQATHQKTIVENSRGVNVTTTDTDIAVNVQILLQILLALVAKLEIL